MHTHFLFQTFLFFFLLFLKFFLIHALYIIEYRSQTNNFVIILYPIVSENICYLQNTKGMDKLTHSVFFKFHGRIWEKKKTKK